MASREMRRIRDRLSGKEKKGEAPKKKVNALTFPSLIIICIVLVGLLIMGGRTLKEAGAITFGYYGGHAIVWKEGNYFAQKIEAVKQRYKEMEYEIIAEFLLPYMRFHTAALVEAERNGIFVSDGEVETYIKGLDPQTVKRYNDMPTVRYEMFQTFKEELIEQKFVAALIRYPEKNQALADAVARMGETERNFRFVEWLYKEYPTEEIVRFADENKDLFRSIKLSRITAKTESEAQDAYDKIINGQSTFAEQLKTVSKIEDESAAALDWQTFHNLQRALNDKEAAERVFSLRQGEISAPVALGSEWLIYRCDQEARPADLSAESTILEVKSYLLDTQKGRIEGYFENKAKEFLATAREKGLEKAAAGLKFPTYETGFFTINFGAGVASTLPFLKKIPEPSSEIGSVASAQYSDLFFKEVFALKKGAVSNPLLLTDKVLVCELVEERRADAASLEEIKGQFGSFRTEDYDNLRAIIADRLFVLGIPQFRSGQQISPADYHRILRSSQLQQLLGNMTFSSSSFYQATAYISQSPIYRSIMGNTEMAGTPEEQATWEAAGLKEFQKLFGPAS